MSEVDGVTQLWLSLRLAVGLLLGAGIGLSAILREGFTVRGLSTAASLWAVGGIGFAAGAGLFVLATAGAVLTAVALELFGQLERPFLWSRGIGAAAPRERQH